MESAAAQLQSLVNTATQLAETRLDIWKLRAAGKVSSATSSLFSLIAVISLAAVSGILFSIGAAILIGHTLGNAAYGFFIIAGFYAMCGLLIFFFRKKWISEPVRNLIISKVTE